MGHGRLILLLFSALLAAGVSDTSPIEVRVRDLERAVRALQSGRPTLTSSPSYLKGATFGENVTLSSSTHVVGNAVFDGSVSAGWERVVGSTVTTSGTADASASASCTAGKYVLGGGCIFDLAAGDYDYWHSFQSYPSASNTWYCYANGRDGAATHNYSLTAYALCARLAP